MRLELREPARDAAVGSRPLFAVGYAAPQGEVDPRLLRFRITLDPVGAADGYEFDQRERPAGWLDGEVGEVVFRPGEPLADGVYRWRAAVWNGREWERGAESRELRIDSVPPADVAGLTVRRDPRSGAVVLEWQPVALDRDGRPEFVVRYHVQRYVVAGGFPILPQHRIGSTEQPRFIDEAPPPDALLFYRVTAEDAAGNVPGERR